MGWLHGVRPSFQELISHAEQPGAALSAFISKAALCIITKMILLVKILAASYNV